MNYFKKAVVLLIIVSTFLAADFITLADYNSVKLVNEIDAKGVLGFTPDGKYYMKDIKSDTATEKIQFYSVITGKLEKSLNFKMKYQSSYSGLGKNYNIRWNNSNDKFLFTSPTFSYDALSKAIMTGIYLCDIKFNKIINIVPEKTKVIFAYPTWANNQEVYYYVDNLGKNNNPKSGIYKLNIASNKSELVLGLSSNEVLSDMFYDNGNLFWIDNTCKKLYRFKINTKSSEIVFKTTGHLLITDIRKNGFALYEYFDSSTNNSSNSCNAYVFRFNSKKNSYDKTNLNFKSDYSSVLYNVCLSPDITSILYSYQDKNGQFVKIIGKKTIEVFKSTVPAAFPAARPSSLNDYANGMYWLNDKIFISVNDKIRIYSTSNSTQGNSSGDLSGKEVQPEENPLSGDEQALIGTSEEELLGNWVDINDPARFASIKSDGTAYTYEDNEGKYPATLKNGALEITAGNGIKAKAYINPYNNLLLETSFDGMLYITEFTRKN